MRKKNNNKEKTWSRFYDKDKLRKQSFSFKINQ